MDKSEIESLKANASILEILAELGIAVDKNRFHCFHPENHGHGDRTPSVSVWPDRGFFKCWVCPEVKGDILALIQMKTHCTFPQALDFLRKRSRFISASSTPVAPASSTSSKNKVEKIQDGEIQVEKIPDEKKRVEKKPIEKDLVPLRLEILRALLNASQPIDGKVASYLQKRRIFKKTWTKQKLRMLNDYAKVSDELLRQFSLQDLEQTGFFNAAGHLRFYRHQLFFPYLDASGQVVYMQARAIDADVKPKELSLSGAIPMPYNAALLDGEPGIIYLCEGVIDTLTLIEQNFPAVGIPGATNFKPAWAALFKNKTVQVLFDPDKAGENGALKTIEILNQAGVEARRQSPPSGKDLNDWFTKG